MRLIRFRPSQPIITPLVLPSSMHFTSPTLYSVMFIAVVSPLTNAETCLSVLVVLWIAGKPLNLVSNRGLPISSKNIVVPYDTIIKDYPVIQTSVARDGEIFVLSLLRFFPSGQRFGAPIEYCQRTQVRIFRQLALWDHYQTCSFFRYQSRCFPMIDAVESKHEVSMPNFRFTHVPTGAEEGSGHSWGILGVDHNPRRLSGEVGFSGISLSLDGSQKRGTK